MKRISIVFLILLFNVVAFGQDQLLNVAREHLRSKDYEKAAATFKQLLEYNPDNQEILSSYLESALAIKDYKNAEKVISDNLKKSPNNEFLLLKSAVFYKAIDEKRKSNKALNKYMDLPVQGFQQVKTKAILLENEGFLQEALEVYLKEVKKAGKENPYLFAEELSILYDKLGNFEKATESLIDLYIAAPNKSESILAAFLQIMQMPEKKPMLKSKIETHIKQNPNMVAYYDLIIWLQIQEKDYAGALNQIIKLDKQYNEDGRRLLNFAQLCLKEKKYDEALNAFDTVIEKGKENPYHLNAKSFKLSCTKEKYIYENNYTAVEIKNLCADYENFLANNVKFKVTETIREYADLEARFNSNIKKGIEILSEVISILGIDKQFKARCKLDMGDYYLLDGDVWESTLLYSQVDKDFKQDMLGEEARFKNAKLTYYNGDFKWAQAQLDVLKASTSELISNDAMDLAILILENNPIKDSNDAPLRLFSQADLFVYQNKTDTAISILNEIENEYPEHPLLDNILMTRAKISYRERNYNDAAKFLQKIIDKHADDVLADDALFQLAEIYEIHFSNKEEAKRLYEKLIVDYSGSTFAPKARLRFRKLRGDVVTEEL
ncbi:MAG: tetratricopeptide repeat protein [Chitinophagaceae bacterium]|nr:tetratricopeptide repeat protein [Chitinophagaceae bacterium]